jgi:hypothetical protein
MKISLSTHSVLLPKVTGQGKNLTGQLRILAGHCPLTGHYLAILKLTEIILFEPTAEGKTENC